MLLLPFSSFPTFVYSLIYVSVLIFLSHLPICSFLAAGGRVQLIIQQPPVRLHQLPRCALQRQQPALASCEPIKFQEFWGATACHVHGRTHETNAAKSPRRLGTLVVSHPTFEGLIFGQCGCGVCVTLGVTGFLSALRICIHFCVLVLSRGQSDLQS